MSGPDADNEHLAEVRSIGSAKSARIRRMPVSGAPSTSEPSEADLKEFFEGVLGADIHYLDPEKEAKTHHQDDASPEEIRGFYKVLWTQGLPYLNGTPAPTEPTQREKALWAFSADIRYPDATRQDALDEAAELTEARLRAAGFYDEDLIFPSIEPDEPL